MIALPERPVAVTTRPYLCHERPDLSEHDTRVVAVRPGAVLLSRSALHPGGGGQCSDTGAIVQDGRTARVTNVVSKGEDHWHVVDEDLVPGPARLRVDLGQRLVLSRLHTVAHVINTLVFRSFAGALVNGAQLNRDGTGRIDFDLSAVAGADLMALQTEVNTVVRAGAAVTERYLPYAEAVAREGMARSMAGLPPATDAGVIRVVEIEGFDQQLCGGLHVTDLSLCGDVRFVKVESKGRQNRRLRFRLADGNP